MSDRGRRRPPAEPSAGRQGDARVPTRPIHGVGALRDVGELLGIAQEYDATRGLQHRERVGERDLSRLVYEQHIDRACHVGSRELPSGAGKKQRIRRRDLVDLVARLDKGARATTSQACSRSRGSDPRPLPVDRVETRRDVDAPERDWSRDTPHRPLAAARSALDLTGTASVATRRGESLRNLRARSFRAAGHAFVGSAACCRASSRLTGARRA
jgi:hypothetical protein